MEEVWQREGVGLAAQGVREEARGYWRLMREVRAWKEHKKGQGIIKFNRRGINAGIDMEERKHCLKHEIILRY